MKREDKQNEFLTLWGKTPKGKIKEMRERIMVKCGVSRNVFYDWLSGRTEIPELCFETIKRLYYEFD